MCSIASNCLRETKLTLHSHFSWSNHSYFYNKIVDPFTQRHSTTHFPNSSQIIKFKIPKYIINCKFH